jgi:hypothetical protein
VICLAQQVIKADAEAYWRHAAPPPPLNGPSTIRLLFDVVTLARLAVTSHTQLAAENLFLRKQLALYQERRVTPRRPDSATRVVLVLLSRLLDWRALLTVVRPDTLIRWHRQAGGSSGAGSRGQDGRRFQGSCSD